jgi:beta-aspartyl-peptidase (threonine type)
MSLQAPAHWALAIHAGAGVAEHLVLDEDRQRRCREGLAAALAAGVAILRTGGAALDAAQEAVRVMEDDVLFNAGRGSVFTCAGTIELDAAVMDGRTLSAGSVAGLTASRNPVLVARAVMERSSHVMIAGDGAEAFAREHGLEAAPPDYFFTPRRWAALEAHLRRLGQEPPPRPTWASALFEPNPQDEGPFGTVGAVARDCSGGLAAATSTGGTTGKRPGRIGDTPIVGAGTYANTTAAVSGTGDGEHFIRLTLARDAAALVEAGNSPMEAAELMIRKRLTPAGGQGGLILADAEGRIGWALNTPVMFRAAATRDRAPQVHIFSEEG